MRGSGHSRTILVGQESGHIRGGGHVRSTSRHDQEGIQDTDGAGEWSESGLQRGTVLVPEGRASRIGGTQIWY